MSFKLDHDFLKTIFTYRVFEIGFPSIQRLQIWQPIRLLTSKIKIKTRVYMKFKLIHTRFSSTLKQLFGSSSILHLTMIGLLVCLVSWFSCLLANLLACSIARLLACMIAFFFWFALLTYFNLLCLADLWRSRGWTQETQQNDTLRRRLVEFLVFN